MLEITLLFYFAADVVLFGIIMSYFVAYRMQKRVYTLSLILFTSAVFVLSAISTYSTMNVIVDGTPPIIPFSALRGLFLLASSSFFLYATWKKNEGG